MPLYYSEGQDEPIMGIDVSRVQEMYMPLFEFRCRDCGSRFEVLTSYEQSEDRMLCAQCQSTNVRKLVSLVARRSTRSDLADSFGGDEGFADSFGGDEDMGQGEEMDSMDSGGCSCGGACSCRN
jgi:putative FmdB family regulatory protein